MCLDSAGQSLRRRFHRDVREREQVVEAISNDGFHDGWVERSVLMHEDVPEAHHRLEYRVHLFVDDSALLQQVEGVAGFLRETELTGADQVVRHIDGGLASSLKIHRDGVLTHLVVADGFRTVPLADPGNAPFDRRLLVQKNVTHEA